MIFIIRIVDIIIYIYANRENIFTLFFASFSETQPSNVTFIEIVKTAFSKKEDA